ncbi:sugar ABC transporter permease, partial [Microbispora sp. SCL1-1]
MKHATQTPAPPTGDGRRERAPAPGAGSTRRRPRRGGPGQWARGQRARGQWAAWAFLVPVVVYLLAFYVYPLYRNVDLSLRNYTVR